MTSENERPPAKHWNSPTKFWWKEAISVGWLCLAVVATALFTALLIGLLWHLLEPESGRLQFLSTLLSGKSAGAHKLGIGLTAIGAAGMLLATLTWLAGGAILIPGGILWLLGIASALVGILLLTSGSALAWSIGFVLVALGTGPIAFLYTDRRTQLLNSQTDSDVFAKAVEMLSYDRVEARQGGIHALERIAKENPAEHPKIMKILAAYIRAGSISYVDSAIEAFQGAMDGGSGGNDSWIAALKVVRLFLRAQDALVHDSPPWKALEELKIRVREWGKPAPNRDPELKVIEQSEVTELLLPNLPMPVDLEAAVDAIRSRMSKEASELLELPRKLDLSNSYLYNVHFSDAILHEANFSDSHIWGSRFEGTDLTEAVLVGASLSEVVLSDATLRKANLRRAKLKGVDLKGADMTGAKLHGADLSGAENLMQEQVKTAFGDTSTRLPSHIARPEHWDQPENESGSTS